MAMEQTQPACCRNVSVRYRLEIILSLTSSLEEELLSPFGEIADFNSQAGMNPRCDGWTDVLELPAS